MKKIILLPTVLFCCLQLNYAQRPGDLDSSFGNNGIVRTDFDNIDVIYNSTAIQSDGKIVVAGTSDGFLTIARYNTDGILDNTFSEDGKQTTDLGLGTGDVEIRAVALQSDGKIVVVGSGRVVSSGSDDFVLVRYNIDGSLDNNFSNDGKQTTDFGGDDFATLLSIQSDGKIVVAGLIIIYIDVNTSDYKIDFALARYNTDGSLDATFSEDGKQITDFGGNNIARSIAIQSDGKIVMAGTNLIPKYDDDEFSYGPDNDFSVARYNQDGTLDSSFSDDGIQTTDFLFESEFLTFHGNDVVSSVAIQSDGKIVVGGQSTRHDFKQPDPEFSFALARYNTDGSLDVKQRASFGDFFDPTTGSRSIAIQNNGKIIIAGYVAEQFAFARFKADGSVDKTFGNNGVLKTSAGQNFYDVSVMNSVAYDFLNDKLYVVGYVANYIDDYTYGVLARYSFNEPKTPTVTLTIPDNIVKYAAPARIKLNAAVADVNGTIKKVRFYSDTTLIHTEDVFPYGFLWINVPVGSYNFTAKAYDDNGNIITSNSIDVSVVGSNVPPVVSIVNPVSDTTYTGPATIRLVAKAKDPNDKISKVEFYNGTTLLRTEYYYPYTYTWINVQPGTYTITAKATDDKGLSATSEPVTITVTAPNVPIVSSRPTSANNKTDMLSLKLAPNPASSTLQIYTSGLLQNKSSTISVISASGIVLKTIQSNSSIKVVQLDVSSLVSGVYTVKVISGTKVMHTRFVKL